MSETKFTKGELIVNQNEQSRDYELLQVTGDDTCYIVAENINSIHDARLFEKSHELYAMLDRIAELASGDMNNLVDEMIFNFDGIEKLLAEARGEHE